MTISASQLPSPHPMAEPSAEFTTVVVLSPSSESFWQRVKRFFLRRGRLQPRSRRTLSRRQAANRAAHFVPSSSGHASQSSTGSGGLGRLRSLTRSGSQSSIHNTPSLRDELAGAWPRLGVSPLQSKGDHSLRRSGSDTFLAMALGSGVGVNDMDYVSELGTVSEAAGPNDGKPYPWMDTPLEGLDNWMMY